MQNSQRGCFFLKHPVEIFYYDRSSSTLKATAGINLPTTL